MPNSYVKSCSHFSSTYFHVFCYFTLVILIYGLIPLIKPYRKMLLSDFVVILLIYIYMRVSRITFKRHASKNCRIPKICDFFHVKIPFIFRNILCDYRAKYFIISHFPIELTDNFINIFSAFDMFHKQQRKSLLRFLAGG